MTTKQQAERNLKRRERYANNFAFREEELVKARQRRTTHADTINRRRRDKYAVDSAERQKRIDSAVDAKRKRREMKLKAGK